MEPKIFLMKSTKINDSSKLWIPIVPELVSLFFKRTSQLELSGPGREACSWRNAALCLHLTPNLIIQITSRNYLVPGQKLFLLRFLPSTECRPIT